MMPDAENISRPELPVEALITVTGKGATADDALATLYETIRDSYASWSPVGTIGMAIHDCTDHDVEAGERFIACVNLRRVWPLPTAPAPTPEPTKPPHVAPFHPSQFGPHRGQQ